MTTSEGTVTENPESITVDIDDIPVNDSNRINLQRDILWPSGEIKDRSALLILNQAIQIPFDLFDQLWQSHSVKVCADGGANRLYEYLEQQDREKDVLPNSLGDFKTMRHELYKAYLPNYIIGDLDSLRDDTRRIYESLGVAVIQQTTQYSTDLMKSINLISLHYNSTKFQKTFNPKLKNCGIPLEHGIHDMYKEQQQSQKPINAKDVEVTDDDDRQRVNILVLGGIGGRFDQTMHSIVELYQLHNRRELASPYHLRMFYLSESDLIFLVPKGGFIIDYSGDVTSKLNSDNDNDGVSAGAVAVDEEDFRKECIGNCGVLPIGQGTVLVSTRGLKWDVSNWATSIASGRVSSSNRFVGKGRCYINARDDIVISIEVFIDKLCRKLAR